MTPAAAFRRLLRLLVVAAALAWGGCRTWSVHEEQAAGFFNEGNTLRDAGRLEDAAAAYEAALEEQPDLAAASYNLALTLTFLGRGEEALDLLEGLRRRDPENLAVLRAMAWVAEESGDSGAALGYYSAALDIFPADEDSLEGAAAIHEAEGRAAEAVVLRRTLVRLDDDAENVAALAESLAEAGEFGASLSRCEDVLAENPNHSDALRVASIAAEAMGLHREAVAYESRRIAAGGGNDPEPWWRTARIDLVELEEFEDGLKALAKALELGFSDEEALQRLLRDAPGVARAGIRRVIFSRESP